MLVSQTEPAVEVIHRNEQGRWELTTAAGLNSRIRIPSIQCELRLRDIYYRVEFPAEENLIAPPRKPGAKKRPAKKAKARKTAPAKRGKK